MPATRWPGGTCLNATVLRTPRSPAPHDLRPLTSPHPPNAKTSAPDLPCAPMPSLALSCAELTRLLPAVNYPDGFLHSFEAWTVFFVRGRDPAPLNLPGR